MIYARLFLMFAVVSLATSSCIIVEDDDFDFDCERGNGNLESREFFLPWFDRVEVEGIANVYIQQGNDFQIIVETDENLMDEVERNVRNDEWVIGYDDCVRNVTEFNVYITMPEIRELTITGSGSITAENLFLGNLLRLNIVGSGDMDIAFEGDRLVTDIEGSGDIRLEGFTDELQHKVDGSGDLYAFGLEANEAYVDVLGSGDSEITVFNLLDARIIGSGNIYYQGNPTVTSEILGSGRLIEQ